MQIINLLSLWKGLYLFLPAMIPNFFIGFLTAGFFTTAARGSRAARHIEPGAARGARNMQEWVMFESYPAWMSLIPGFVLLGIVLFGNVAFSYRNKHKKH